MQYPPPHGQQRPPLPPPPGMPWWGWLLIVLGILIVGSFAGCASCMYCTSKALEEGPSCITSKPECQACCKRDGMKGGRLEQRRTRMNGAKYTACVCD